MPTLQLLNLQLTGTSSLGRRWLRYHHVLTSFSLSLHSHPSPSLRVRAGGIAGLQIDPNQVLAPSGCSTLLIRRRGEGGPSLDVKEPPHTGGIAGIQIDPLALMVEGAQALTALPALFTALMVGAALSAAPTAGPALSAPRGTGSGPPVRARPTSRACSANADAAARPHQHSPLACTTRSRPFAPL